VVPYGKPVNLLHSQVGDPASGSRNLRTKWKPRQSCKWLQHMLEARVGWQESTGSVRGDCAILNPAVTPVSGRPIQCHLAVV